MTIKLANTLSLPREKWLELRRQGIGGSDAATVVGLNPYSSRLWLYADKLGLVPEKEDNESMRQGRDLEEYVASRWEEKTGKKCRRENHVLMNPTYPWAYANIDRSVVGGGVLECKTTSVYNKADFDAGEIPPNYYTQVQHYLAVTGADMGYLAVMVLNKGFYTYEIPRSEEDIAALMESERLFWEDHVRPQIPPEPDGSDSAQQVLDMVARTENTALLMDSDAAFQQMAEVGDKIKELEREKDALKQVIIQKLGSSSYGKSYGWTCSYLQQTRTTVDSKALLERYPQAFKDCAKTSTFSTLRVKKAK
jgi:putative phage-type endonuclease